MPNPAFMIPVSMGLGEADVGFTKARFKPQLFREVLHFVVPLGQEALALG